MQQATGRKRNNSEDDQPTTTEENRSHPAMNAAHSMGDEADEHKQSYSDAATPSIKKAKLDPAPAATASSSAATDPTSAPSPSSYASAPAAAAVSVFSRFLPRHSSSSLFLRLPDVLVQSLMHWMVHTEIIALARSCKHAMRCADSSFAWRHCPAANHTFPESHSSPLSSRLQRWASLSLHVRISAELIDRIRQFASSSRLVKLHLRLYQSECEAAVVRLFGHPVVFPYLEEIGGLNQPSVQLITAVAALPALTALQLWYCAADPLILSPLVGARGLRRLSLCFPDDELVNLSAIMQHPQLTSLSLYAPSLNASNFVAFCAAISGLQELELMQWTADVGSEANLAAGLRMLVSLHTLQVAEVSKRFDGWLPLLPECVPSLRQLDISAQTFPSGLALLMRASPNLHLNLCTYSLQKGPEDILRPLMLEPFMGRVTLDLVRADPYE